MSLVVCSKYKEMYGKILKSLTIVKLYRGMSKLKVKINVAKYSSIFFHTFLYISNKQPDSPLVWVPCEESANFRMIFEGMLVRFVLSL